MNKMVARYWRRHFGHGLRSHLSGSKRNDWWRNGEHVISLSALGRSREPGVLHSSCLEHTASYIHTTDRWNNLEQKCTENDIETGFLLDLFSQIFEWKSSKFSVFCPSEPQNTNTCHHTTLSCRFDKCVVVKIEIRVSWNAICCAGNRMNAEWCAFNTWDLHCWYW